MEVLDFPSSKTDNKLTIIEDYSTVTTRSQPDSDPLYNNPLDTWKFEVISSKDVCDAKVSFLEELIELSESTTDIYALQEIMRSKYETLHPTGLWQKIRATKTSVSKWKRYCMTAHSALYWTSTAASLYSNREYILLAGKFAFQFIL